MRTTFKGSVREHHSAPGTLTVEYSGEAGYKPFEPEVRVEIVSPDYTESGADPVIVSVHVDVKELYDLVNAARTVANV